MILRSNREPEPDAPDAGVREPKQKPKPAAPAKAAAIPESEIEELALASKTL